jgi:CheY-like chemotaxis protein
MMSEILDIPWAERSGGAKTVLVVEDEPAVACLVRLILEQCGYRVLEAPCGAEALRLVREHPGPIHLLLAGVVLPGVDGCDFASHLSAVRPGLEVVFMTGDPDAVERSGLEGIEYPLLGKPFSPGRPTHP